MLRAEHVRYDYIRRDEKDNVAAVETAVNDVSFEIEPGQFVVVLGHNGSGKSTLARHMNALLIPESGTVFVDGMDTSQEEMVWEIRSRVGMVFQNPDNQLVHNVVEEDVAFGPENLGIPSEEIRRRVDEALEKTGMSDYASESPNNLSGGQKQRVAIAGILAMKPKCIVFDEATAMLDPLGRREVLEAVRDLNRTEKITILWITHYMEEAVDADRVMVMSGGQIAMDGKPREIFDQVEKLQKYHLDVPQVTLLAHKLRKAGMQIPPGILRVEELVDAIAGILKSQKG